MTVIKISKWTIQAGHMPRQLRNGRNWRYLLKMHVKLRPS